MSSRRGNQKPTFSCVGEYHSSAGKKLCKIFESWGVKFYPCQKEELELFVARDKDGSFASRTICISKPRQNGKSFGARKYAEVMAAKGKRVLYSAHNGGTARRMFKMIVDDFESTPELFDRLKTNGIYRAQGSEAIELKNRGIIQFQTRTNSGTRGETYDVIVVDEAQELTYDQLDAIKPTTLASDSGDPQMIYIGTPPGPTCRGEVFRDYHDQAHQGDSTSIWWLEWAVDEIPDISDRKTALRLAYKTNPAMGYRITDDVMLDAINSYQARPDSFAREFLGWWSPKVIGSSAIDFEAWKSCSIDEADVPEPKKKTIGIKFSADGARCAIAVAAMGSEGIPHLEIVQDENITAVGIGWVADFIQERADTYNFFAIDGRGNADALTTLLQDRGVSKRAYIRCGTREVIAANAMLQNAVREKALTHLEDPALAESVATSIRRAIGSSGGFGFDGNYTGPVEASALALWALRTTKRNPNRKMRVL